MNAIFPAFFLAAFAAALAQALGLGMGAGDSSVWTGMAAAVFSTAQEAFAICLNLAGMLCFWLGLMKVAEAAGITKGFARILSPLFGKLMPEVPKNHPAIGSIALNMAANMLGLDNAATPAGLKAMEQLQTLNKSKDKDEATNAQILFIVINASSVTLVPITVMMYRAQLGSAAPAAVFVPILLATSASTLAAFLAVAAIQKLDIFNRVVLAYAAAAAAIVGGIAAYFYHLPPAERLSASADAGNFVLIAVIVGFIACGLTRRVRVYEQFIEGAKEGFDTAIRIVPYLVAILVAIALFRASGAFAWLMAGFEKATVWLGLPTGFLPALPTALVKPFSGAGARAVMLETMQTYGADSFPAFAAALIQGSTETTFYVLAVYFGAVGVKRARHALPCALLADLVGAVAAIALAYVFFEGV